MSLLVTDMCCDLSKEFCERNHVLVMPMVYNLNGTDYVHSFAKESPGSVLHGSAQRSDA